jgi:hypothetical protein
LISSANSSLLKGDTFELSIKRSNFFYFHGAKYLENLDDGSIWQAGHTHTAIKSEYTDTLGKKHLLLCNPVGYPDEEPYAEHGTKKGRFFWWKWK